MGWDVIAGLTLQYGMPFAESLIQKWETGAPVTSAEWADLKSLAQQQAKDRMLKVLTAQGIDPASDKGKALLALVQ